MTFAPDGDLYVALGYQGGSVSRVDGTNGAIINTLYAPGFIPIANGHVFGPDGNLYVAAEGANQVVRFDGMTGAMLDVFASGGDLVQPTGLTFGPDGNLYVSSHNYGGNNRNLAL